MREMTNPTYNSSSMINTEKIKSQSFNHSIQKECKNRQSIGDNDQRLFGYSEASKPSTSFGQRKDINDGQVTNTAYNQYDNVNLSNEKLNQFAIEKALRTAQMGSKAQPKRLVNQH